jgi:hypothetical protein
LSNQVNRLAKLLENLESKPLKLEANEEDIINLEKDPLNLLVSRKLQVKSSEESAFKKILKKYAKSAKKVPGHSRYEHY